MLKQIWKYLSFLGLVTTIIGGMTAIACLVMSELVPIENKVVICGLLIAVLIHTLDMEDKVDKLRSTIRRLKERR